MAFRSSINNLKQRPKDERTAVASGIAFTVVIVLLAGWAIYFFHKIQTGAITPTLDAGVQNQFNPQSVQQAQQALQDQYGSAASDLQQLRDQIGAVHTQANQQTTVQPAPGATDQFGLPSAGTQ